MSVTRSQLRKLRNKVYIRILSSQTFQKQLERYRNLTEAFILEGKPELALDEIAALKIRVERTEKAAAESSNVSFGRNVDDEIIKRLGRMGVQSLGSPVYSTSKENSFFSWQSRDHLVPSLASTLAITCKEKNNLLNPTMTSIVASTCWEEEDILATSSRSKNPTLVAGVQPYVSHDNSTITATSTEAASDAKSDHLGDDILKRFRMLRGQSTLPSDLCPAKNIKSWTDQTMGLTSVPTKKTEDSALTSFSQYKNTSMALTEEESDMQNSVMDSVSEAMSIMLTLATSSENHGMVNSFMEELKDTMRMTTEVTTVTADISVAEEVFEPAIKGKTQRNFWTRLKNSLLG